MKHDPDMTLDGALEMLARGVEIAPSQDYPVAVNQRLATAAVQAACQCRKAPHAACKAGCSHCCHIPAKISAVAARTMGKAIGRTPAPAGAHAPLADTGYASPCPFLQAGRCSVYAHRPAVCRT